MPDLGPLFALGQALAEQAIATGGTTVRAETRSVTVDPETLAATTTSSALFGSTGALVVPSGALTAQPLPDVEVRTTDWKVVLPAATVPPPVGAFVVVESSRNAWLVGRSGVVLGSSLDSAGAVLLVFARPVV